MSCKVNDTGEGGKGTCTRAAAYSSGDPQLAGWASWFQGATTVHVCAEHAGVLMHYGLSCSQLPPPVSLDQPKQPT